MARPKIAITAGDAAGVGPEIIVKMFAKHDINKYADIFVIGDLFPMLSAQRRISRKIAIRPVLNIEKLGRNKNIINLLDMKALKSRDAVLGKAQTEAGRASFLYIKKAIELAMLRKIDAIVTAPINKHALHMAGIKYPGHTEILAKFTKTKKYAMMLLSDKLKVVLVTIHTSIKSVPSLITKKSVLEIIKLTDNSLHRDFGVGKPRIAVAGLNPHAGEAGAFGTEEQRAILPAIRQAQKSGINAEGPFPPDTIFHRVVKYKTHDAVIAMYHDQGLIPLKLTGFEDGVNVTLGLPIVRTSPDHGTAYDIAGTGKADESSIISALKVAIEIAKNRKKV